MMIDESEFSVVQDLLKTASLFNLLDDVRNMITRGLQYSKQAWKNKVWACAWELEDVYFCAVLCSQELGYNP